MIILKLIKRFLDRVFFVVLRSFLGKKTGNNTLLLVRTDGIGDFVYFSRYLVSLRDAFRGFRIILVCRRELSGFAREFPSIDAVIGFRYLAYRWNYLYRLFILWKIRSFCPEQAVYCSFHRLHIGDEMTLLSGTGETTALSGNDEGIHPAVRAGNDRQYSRIVRVDDNIPEANRYAALFETLGVPNLQSESFTLRSVLRSPRDGHPGGMVIIAPGGSARIRRWPPERFASVINQLGGDAKGRVVLVGSRGERSLLDSIARQTVHGAAVLTGLPLIDVAGIIQEARLFIGNENGLLHMAASTGIPAVGILGGGHFSRYFPYGRVRIINHKLDCYECNWSCPFPEPYCLTRISVEDVVKEARALLASQAEETKGAS